MRPIFGGNWTSINPNELWNKEKGTTVLNHCHIQYVCLFIYYVVPPQLVLEFWFAVCLCSIRVWDDDLQSTAAFQVGWTELQKRSDSFWPNKSWRIIFWATRILTHTHKLCVGRLAGDFQTNFHGRTCQSYFMKIFLLRRTVFIGVFHWWDPEFLFLQSFFKQPPWFLIRFVDFLVLNPNLCESHHFFLPKSCFLYPKILVGPINFRDRCVWKWGLQWFTWVYP